MKKFDVFINQEKKIKLVRHDFNWLAFWFTLLWAILKLHFIKSILVVVVFIIIINLFNLIEYDKNVFLDSVAFIIFISFNIFFGLNGNKWNKERLLKNNYKLVGTVNGNFYDEAYRDAYALVKLKST